MKPILSESKENGGADGAHNQHPQLDALSGGTYLGKRALAPMGSKTFEDGHGQD